VTFVKIVIAPDSFKGSLSAPEVCEWVARALLDTIPAADVVSVPMADGGEGTLEALVKATLGRTVPIRVPGPLREEVDSKYGVLGDGKTVVIELANIAGLPMVPEVQRDPFQTSTQGVGTALRMAMDAGYRDFIVGIGGSATNDGGMGFLHALGATFLDDTGRSVAPIGGELNRVRQVDMSGLDSRLRDCRIAVASDVENPLCGPRGASAVFGPQKGATPEQVRALDDGLHNFAGLVESHLHQSFQHQPGAGAAGGMGFALLATGASIQSGARLVADAALLSNHLTGADFVITGEGRTDEQTLYGKVPFVVAQLGRQCGVKSILLSGSLGHNLVRRPETYVAREQSDSTVKDTENEMFRLEEMFISLHSIVSRPMSVVEAMEDAKSLLYFCARNVAALLALAKI
jgi:glycerate 2-kinase